MRLGQGFTKLPRVLTWFGNFEISAHKVFVEMFIRTFEYDQDGFVAPNV